MADPKEAIKSKANALRKTLAQLDKITGAAFSVTKRGEVADFCGVQHAIGVSSGTDALLAALMALDIGPGDEVITPSYSFFATAGVIARLGAKPVFTDICPDTFNLDPESVAAKISPRTKAVVPVHLFGRVGAMDSLLSVCDEKKIPVIEDAAQAIGAKDKKGRQAGSMGLGGCFSFFPSKNLGAFGDGGMVDSNDGAFAEKVKLLRAHGSQPKYYHKIVGGNLRLDALQAAVLRVKLKHLSAWSQSRRKNAARYVELFRKAKLGGIVSLPPDESGHIYNQFVIRTARRDDLRAFLKSQDIETEIYYPVILPLQECFAGLGHKKGDFPQAEAAASESLALPIYPELSDAQAAHVVSSIASFFSTREERRET